MTKDEAATLTLRITDLIKAMIIDAKRDSFHSAKAVGAAGDALEAALITVGIEPVLEKVTESMRNTKDRYLLGCYDTVSKCMKWISAIGTFDHRWTTDPAFAVSFAVLADAERVRCDLKGTPGLVVVVSP